ncbi:Cyclin-dependent kinase 2-associated protein 2 [Aphelenchoides bicaudatus]|nr:Cyclin-dependent kinase 2-associated protein 2 [Aphelenchoides bicaudatus]
MMNSEDLARALAALSAAGINAANLTNAAASPSTSMQASTSAASLPQYSVPGPVAANASKYSQLLALIEELGKDIRLTYAGNRNCTERLKRGITHARVLVRECLHEVERNNRASTQ